MYKPAKQLFGLAVVACILLQSCRASSSSSQPVLTVAAASSLSAALNEIGRGYEAKTGTPVVFSFASTGALAQQIRNGAPFDIFAAADAAHIDALIESGLIDRETRTEFALGQLVLILDPSLAGQLTGLADLTKPEVTRIALANPIHAPYGIAGQRALRNVGIWDEVKEKVVYAETVRQAVQMVETGNARAGIVSASLVISERLLRLPIHADLHDPIVHVLGLLNEATHYQEAIRFRAYLLSPEGRAVLEKYQFRVSTEP